MDIGKEKLTGPCAISSSHVADQGDGPLYAQDADDCTDRAIGGVRGQLLDQNSLPLNKAHADFDGCKKLPLGLVRSNIAAIRNENVQDKIALYAKIASVIGTKSIRDVAWRVRLMAEIFSDPSAKSSYHVADQEDECTYQGLSEIPEAMERMPPHLKLDKELVCMTACFFPDHQCWE